MLVEFLFEERKSLTQDVSIVVKRQKYLLYAMVEVSLETFDVFIFVLSCHYQESTAKSNYLHLLLSIVDFLSIILRFFLNMAVHLLI